MPLPILSIACLLAAQVPPPPPLPAPTIARQQVTCPVCGYAFEAFAGVEEDGAGGVDRDLFARAIGPQPEFYRVSTCPACLYSGYLTDFTAAGVVPPDVIAKVLKKPRLPRPAGVTKDTDQRFIDARDRYALAITCYQWRQRSDEAIAWLHLRASWVVRDMAVVVPRTPKLERILLYARRWHPARTPGTNQADAEMEMVTQAAAALAEGRFSRYQAPYVRFFVAMLLRKQGENEQASPLLEELAGETLLEEPLRTAAGRMLDSIAAEQAHQRAAVTHMERALLAEQVAPANRPVAMYITGELCRRLGRNRDAVRWLDRASDSGKLPTDLRRWALEQKELAQGGADGR